MKYLVPAILVLAACSSNTAAGEYDIQAFEAALAQSPAVDRATSSMASEQLSIGPAESMPSGFVSLFEQQPDGAWMLKNDPALLP